MQKLLSAAIFFLMSLPVLAAKELDAASAPAETVDMVYVVIFGVIFLGSIVGFFIYLFMTDKGEKSGK